MDEDWSGIVPPEEFIPDCIFFGHHGPGEEDGWFTCSTCNEECTS